MIVAILFLGFGGGNISALALLCYGNLLRIVQQSSEGGFHAEVAVLELMIFFFNTLEYRN
jgi:hypothetical protein